MTDFDNTNRGAIWKNDKKETDRHPDFKGSINIDGTDYWLSGWLRGANDNPKSPSMKFSVQKKDQQVSPSQAMQTPQQTAPVDNGFIEDAIPF